ncbi:MAG: hypothetical protein DWP97_06810 [Calditrichaeota bacterium]|nr:MAG: hypothetical protein DWP97_06810 [Calditrichota bacterium]
MKFSIRLLAFILTFSAVSAFAADKLPAAKAGTIGKATGKIAFIRNGDIWAMDATGQNQYKVCASGNADGRLSWSPDGKMIAFTRSGQVNYRSPDNLGGQHKLYDIFIAYLDSAYANNTQYWYRITSGLGSRDPEWAADGSKIVFWKDMNSNIVDAFAPQYQVMTIEPDGSSEVMLRKDWQSFYENFLTRPTMNANGDLAAVYFNKQNQLGLVVLSPSEYMADMDSLMATAERHKGMIAPAWSPDGKWIAYIDSDMTNSGLYIISADLKEKYIVAPPPVGTYMMTYPPSWSPDSKWMTFSTTDGSVWIVDITGNGLRRLTGPGPDKGPAWSK